MTPALLATFIILGLLAVGGLCLVAYLFGYSACYSDYMSRGVLPERPTIMRPRFRRRRNGQPVAQALSEEVLAEKEAEREGWNSVYDHTDGAPRFED